MSGIFLKKKTKGEPAPINLPFVPEGPNQGNAEKHVELDTDCHGPPIQPLVEFIVYTYTDHRHPPPPNTNTFNKFNINHGLFFSSRSSKNSQTTILLEHTGAFRCPP